MDAAAYRTVSECVALGPVAEIAPYRAPCAEGTRAVVPPVRSWRSGAARAPDCSQALDVAGRLSRCGLFVAVCVPVPDFPSPPQKMVSDRPDVAHDSAALVNAVFGRAAVYLFPRASVAPPFAEGIAVVPRSRVAAADVGDRAGSAGRVMRGCWLRSCRIAAFRAADGEEGGARRTAHRVGAVRRSCRFILLRSAGEPPGRPTRLSFPWAVVLVFPHGGAHRVGSVSAWVFLHIVAAGPFRLVPAARGLDSWPVQLRCSWVASVRAA